MTINKNASRLAGRIHLKALFATGAFVLAGAAHAVPTAVNLGGELCLDMPPANHRLSDREVIDNERCAQKMAADKEEEAATDAEIKRKVAEGKRHPMHDVPPDPADCEATAGLTDLTMETSNMTRAQARADQAKREYENDRLFNVHTRYDLCPQAEPQLIYRMSEALRRKQRGH
jgi:uncharacterized protein YpuA (DUF1002 family)